MLRGCCDRLCSRGFLEIEVATSRRCLAKVRTKVVTWSEVLERLGAKKLIVSLLRRFERVGCIFIVKQLSVRT